MSVSEPGLEPVPVSELQPQPVSQLAPAGAPVQVQVAQTSPLVLSPPPAPALGPAVAPLGAAESSAWQTYPAVRDDRRRAAPLIAQNRTTLAGKHGRLMYIEVETDGNGDTHLIGALPAA